MRNPYIFGIRHLSPAGAWHLRQFLDEKKPKIVLVEGPEDFNDQIPYLTHPETRFPVDTGADDTLSAGRIFSGISGCFVV